MANYSVIGNLGNDAVVKTYNGQQFVTFDVADTNSWTDENGNKKEETIWVSCSLNGDGGKLLPYLKRGKKVFVSGRCSVRVYSSKVQRRMCAGINLHVREIELIGGAADEVPRQLVAGDGTLVDVLKCYYIKADVARAYGATEQQDIIFTSARGGQYRVNYNGFITVEKADEQTANETAEDSKQ